MARRGVNRFGRFLAGLFLALAVMLPGPGLAHNNHVSVSSVDYNPRTENFEIIHEFFAHDLMAVLSVYAGERLSLDEPDLEARIQAYVEHSFAISVADTPAKLDWVGVEIAGDRVTTYQEMPVAAIPPAVTVHNQLFMEEFPDQLNTVNIRIGDMVRSGRFTQDARQQLIDLRP